MPGWTRIQRLDAKRTTLLLDCAGDGIPRIAYWGGRLNATVDPATLAATADRPVPHGGLDDDAPLSLLPEPGAAFMGQPGLAGCRGRRDWITRFALDDAAREGQQLTLTCHDDRAELTLTINLTLDADTGVLCTQSHVTNRAAQPYDLRWCAAGVYPLPAWANELLTLEGRWSREFQIRRQAFPDQALVSDNRTGRTSHHSFPGLVAGRPGFGEQHGEVFGFHLGWSGNHRWLAERLPDGRQQIQLGELLLAGEIVLGAGETYSSPPAYAAWSSTGLSALADSWHRFLRSRVLPAMNRPRPVHVNTWEAFYFDHEPARLKVFAEQAAELGAERFVLDDGWFLGRSDDTRALGDWTVDPAKYPNGLGELIDHVQRQGMEFGLWVEPEMVNADSDLFRAHPDWILALAGREQPLGRGQFVLDLTRKEVSDCLFDGLDRLLTNHAIVYLKWDMNRDLTHPGHDGIAAVHAQTQAVYRLIDRLRERHPAMEIESCASGGGRADFGMLQRTHRVWASDCNDAVERQAIQRGFSLFFPPEIMGAHIGPNPAHTTGRHVDFDFQGATALFGHFGLELDITALDCAQREIIKAWVDLYKVWRPLLHRGHSIRLDVDESGATAYGVVADDSRQALFVFARVASARASVPPPLRLAGLDAARSYRVRLVEPPAVKQHAMKHLPPAYQGQGTVQNGEWLTRVGVQLPITTPQSALLVHLEAVA